MKGNHPMGDVCALGIKEGIIRILPIPIHLQESNSSGLILERIHPK